MNAVSIGSCAAIQDQAPYSFVIHDTGASLQMTYRSELYIQPIQPEVQFQFLVFHANRGELTYDSGSDGLQGYGGCLLCSRLRETRRGRLRWTLLG